MLLLLFLFILATAVVAVLTKYYYSYRKTQKRLAELDFEHKFFNGFIELLKTHQNYNSALDESVEYLKNHLPVTNIVILAKVDNTILFDENSTCLDYLQNNKHIFWRKLSAENIIIEQYEEKETSCEIFIVAFWEPNNEIIAIICKKGQVYPFGSNKLAFFEKLSSVVNILRLLPRKMSSNSV